MVFAILAKDLLLELRTKDILVTTLVFGLLVIVVFNFALDPTPAMIATVAPGILWVSFTFGGVLGLNRSFSIESSHGNLQGLMLAPVGRDAIYFGKFLSNFLFMVGVEVVIFPLFLVLFNLPLTVYSVIPVLILATIAIAAVGTVFSAMAVNTRSREVMLPLLFFPVVVPVIIAAAEATGILLRDAVSTDGASTFRLIGPGVSTWIPMLVVFDAVFLVICPAAFSFIIED
ncbi:MAG: heme exporter protein CcmB [Dehalococcoidia bacterium]|nr:heme exporter protein CcmB [Dehalococcoidia bacterium]